MSNYSGYTAETPKSLLLDAGAFFKNFYVGTDTFESARSDGKLIGATQGGGQFSAVPTIRRIEVDGIKGAAKGLEVIDEWVITLTANVKEVTKKTIQMALTASKTGVSGDYDTIEAKNEIALTDYVDNITWVGKLSGSNSPVIIQIYNALNTTGLDLNVADKDEATLALTFMGHYADTDQDTPPFKVFYPQAITNTVTPATATVIKSAPTDTSFTITSSDGAICGGASLGGQYVVSSAYTITGGTFKFKKEYLGTLVKATHAFTLLMDKGNNVSVSITVN